MIPVCVFAKAPEPGKVKTRLINALGSEGAARLAAAMFRDTWDMVSKCAGARPVLATLCNGAFPIAIDSGNVWLQGDGDLGMRLEKILRQGLGCACAAIAIGADAPSLTTGHLQAAIRALENFDVVIGRSADGGFYLLGLRQCAEGLLAQIPWSTCETAEATVLRMRDRGLTVHELTPLFDVDTPEDLDVLVDYLRTNSSAAPATRAWCIENGLLKDHE